jgi:hypothetical protein
VRDIAPGLQRQDISPRRKVGCNWASSGKSRQNDHAGAGEISGSDEDETLLRMQREQKGTATQIQVRTVYFAYIWHGFFIAVTMSMIDLNTVFAALITELTASKILFGTFCAVMQGAPLVFNLIFSHFIQRYSYKKKFLLLGIYLRSLAFLGMALTTHFLGQTYPNMSLFLLFLCVSLFSVSAGFAGMAYADVIGKTLHTEQRIQLYAVKEIFGNLAAFTGGIIIAMLFKPGILGFPDNYTYIFGVGFIGLIVSSLGFYLIHEPAATKLPSRKDSLFNYIRRVPSVIRQDRRLGRFILVENLASFGVMILPFYLLLAKDTFALDQSYIGKCLLLQVAGAVLSNLVWSSLGGHTGARMIARVCILLGALTPIAALVLSKTNANLYSVVFLLIGAFISSKHVGFEAHLLNIAPDECRTVYLGIRGTLNIMIVFLPVLGGFFISTFGYVPVFAFISAIMVISFMIFDKRPSKTD